MDDKVLFTETRKDRARRLFTALSFSDEEVEALIGSREMTQDLFEKCLDTCVSTHDPQAFFNVWKQFPKLAQANMAKINEELKIVKIPIRRSH